MEWIFYFIPVRMGSAQAYRFLFLLWLKQVLGKSQPEPESETGYFETG